MSTTIVKTNDAPLVVTDVATLKAESPPMDGIKVNYDDKVLNHRVDEFLDKLLNEKDKDIQRNSIDSIGQQTQQSVGRSEMLKGQIRVLGSKGADGGDVANALLNLKDTVEVLDPNKFDFDAPKNFFLRMLKDIPLVGNPLKKYFEKYLTAQEVIDAIIKSLQVGRESLVRDNKILSADQEKIRGIDKKLIELIGFMQVLDKKLEDKAAEMDMTDADHAKFIREELIFSNKQRIIDMQQSLLVNQEAILTMEVVIRNNRELIRGVDRALNTTIQALQTAVLLSLALAHQRIVLDKITALNTTTDNMIAQIGEKLKMQAVEINKKASSATLSIENLKKTFGDIRDAMNEISKFRIEALPSMDKDISAMEELTSEAQKSIQKMEAGSNVQNKISVDFNGEEFKIGK